MDELEEKIEVLLAQNSHLVDENESLIRLVQQKKSEVETWKVRFEGEYTNSNNVEAEKKKIFDHLNIRDQEHQGQVDKLLAEISRLHDEIDNLEKLKQIEISTLKNKYESEALSQIQNLKRSQYGNNELQ
jgi:predicted RNase H-like nuclease (RuvC/YqgF family)